jgi:hypothetical protein
MIKKIEKRGILGANVRITLKEINFDEGEITINVG